MLSGRRIYEQGMPFPTPGKIPGAGLHRSAGVTLCRWTAAGYDGIRRFEARPPSYNRHKGAVPIRLGVVSADGVVD
jgi:hypothetical protein